MHFVEEHSETELVESEGENIEPELVWVSIGWWEEGPVSGLAVRKGRTVAVASRAVELSPTEKTVPLGIAVVARTTEEPHLQFAEQINLNKTL